MSDDALFKKAESSGSAEFRTLKTYGGTSKVSWRDGFLPGGPEEQDDVNLAAGLPKQRVHSSQSYCIGESFADEEATPLVMNAKRAHGSLSPVLRRRSESAVNASRSSFASSESSFKESIFPDFHNRWLPDIIESVGILYNNDDSSLASLPKAGNKKHHRPPPPPPKFRPRSLKRRMYLFLAEPTSSKGAALLYFLIIFAIAFMNVVMMMQTMSKYQYTPKDCITCGGEVVYTFEDDSIEAPLQKGVACECPPTPFEWTNVVLQWLIYFFTVEWILRVVLFEPPLLEDEDYFSPGEHHHHHRKSRRRRRARFWGLWFSHLTEATTVLDALAIFPFYLESLDSTNGLMSFRLLRLFRVFQLVRLGQYNTTFMSLTNVLWQSLMYLRLLLVVLVFGAALFGSLMYWLEKGSWQFHEASESYRFMRMSVDGVTEEPSPFTSIPAAFWWFMVTATTVGYGDMYPTTTAGKFVATMAMLMGVLVVAVPVSVFSDLWSKEIDRNNIARAMDDEDFDDEDDDNGNLKRSSNGDETGDGLSKKRSHVRSMSSDIADSNSNFAATRAMNVDTLWSSIGGMSFLPTNHEDESVHAGSPPQNLTTEMATTATSSIDEGSWREKAVATAGDVPMKLDDLQEIMDRLEDIRENENRIRHIMTKYTAMSLLQPQHTAHHTS